MELLFRILLVLTPLTLLAAWTGQAPVLIFVLAALAVVPLAKYVGEATEELAARTTPAWGGLLNATFGNATELIIGILALHAGLIDVVKASLAGSIIGNLLLVLGTAMFVGGVRHTEQKFNSTAAKASGSLLLVATIALVIPAIFLSTTGAPLHAEYVLSNAVAVIMILAYAASLVFSLHTHRHLYLARDVEALDGARWPVSQSIIVLAAATLAVALVSEALVNALSVLVSSFGWSQLFIGAIVVAIVGNVAEHLSAIQAARNDRMDLALSISTGSATQIVMFVTPLLVLLSLALGHPMTLVFDLFLLVSMVLAVFVANAVVEDGASNWLEGVQLVSAYAIIALAFYFHP